MNGATPTVLNGLARGGSAARRWMGALALMVVTAILLLYYPTTHSTVAIWDRSETFAHGFLIFPISAFLIWRRRQALAAAPIRPDYRGLALLAALGFGWLLAQLGAVLVVAQYCLVAMIPAAVWTVFGTRVVRTIAFPLGFLFFAVPVGEVLIPPLMHFTADFTVGALRLSGIPVYREGTFFTIPSGNWSVVEGCSGLRYLIAAFTLGCLYAYLTYRSTGHRLLFAAASVIVPIIANGLRAYTIVMIATLIDMRLARGIDHLIYGWVFFGVVMMLLFWVGSFWREDEYPAQASGQQPAEHGQLRPAAGGPVLLAAFLGLAVAGVWPAYAAYLERTPIPTAGLHIAPPVPDKGWLATGDALTDWRPHFAPPDAFLLQTYRKGGHTVALYLEYYRYQRAGAELITSTNVMVVQKDPAWGNVGEGARTVRMGTGQQTKIVQTKLRSSAQRLLVWHWDWIRGHSTANPYWGKWLFATARLFGNPDDGAAIIIATPYEEKPDEVAPVLQAFVKDMQNSIDASLNHVSRQ